MEETSKLNHFLISFKTSIFQMYQLFGSRTSKWWPEKSCWTFKIQNRKQAILMNSSSTQIVTFQTEKISMSNWLSIADLIMKPLWYASKIKQLFDFVWSSRTHLWDVCSKKMQRMIQAHSSFASLSFTSKSMQSKA